MFDPLDMTDERRRTRWQRAATRGRPLASRRAMLARSGCATATLAATPVLALAVAVVMTVTGPACSSSSDSSARAYESSATFQSSGGKSGAKKKRKVLSVQRGQAAWYGGKFHGRKTASGEIFNKNKLTAAHRRLPCGTIVRVTNLRNKRSVTVRITDRGPFNKKRIIDMSEAAARRLGMIKSGVAPVKVEVLRYPARKSKKRGK
ncbi:MAG: septal ring lytic transglycosylase RlpA family protein [Myxococcota bacterium]